MHQEIENTKYIKKKYSQKYNLDIDTSNKSLYNVFNKRKKEVEKYEI